VHSPQIESEVLILQALLYQRFDVRPKTSLYQITAF